MTRNMQLSNKGEKIQSILRGRAVVAFSAVFSKTSSWHGPAGARSDVKEGKLHVFEGALLTPFLDLCKWL